MTSTASAELFAMWAVMMAGMMLPSAVPTLAGYPGVARKSALAGGYVLVWTGFALVATLLNPVMDSVSRALGATLLVTAGIYQLTPWKRACLDLWRSPLHPRAHSGGFRLGLLHGLYSLGCCWALMLLLFVGGVMNLWCIAALTIFVLLERVLPFGTRASPLSGVLLIALGVWYLAAPSIG